MGTPSTDIGKRINLVHPKYECHPTNESPNTQMLRAVTKNLINKKAKIESERAGNGMPNERLLNAISSRKKTIHDNSLSNKADGPTLRSASTISKQPHQSILKPEKKTHVSPLEPDTEADTSSMKPPTQESSLSKIPFIQASSSTKNPLSQTNISSKKSLTVSDAYAKKYAPHVAETESLEDLHNPSNPIPREFTKVSNDILNNAVSAFTNMHIPHEICINPEYRIKPTEKLDTLETEIQKSLKQAFWDIIDEDFKRKVPTYDKIPGVIHDLRITLLGLLLPHNDYVRTQIEDTLDVVEIQREIDRGILDFKKYVNFICNILLKICSPLRDKQVKAITAMEQPFDILNSLFDVMEWMQLDMANYLVSLFRPAILEHSVQYEREKFSQFLLLEYGMQIDGFAATRKWLNRHFMEGRRAPTQIVKAFSEFLNWKFDCAWPETVALDGLRISEICQGLRRSTFVGAMVLTVSEFCRPFFNKENRKVVPNLLTLDLDKQFQVLVSLENVTFPDKLADDVAACAEEAVKIVGNYLKKYENKTMPDPVKKFLRQSVIKNLDHDNKIRSLIRGRIVQYLEETVFSENSYKVPIPPGLNVIKLDVDLLVCQFARIVYHNRCVFNDVYVDIIEKNCPEPQFSQGSDKSEFPKYLNKLSIACHSPAKSFPTRKEELQCIKHPPTYFPDAMKSETSKLEGKEALDVTAVDGSYSETDMNEPKKEEGQELPIAGLVKGRYAVDDLMEKCEAISLVTAHQGSEGIPDVSSSVLLDLTTDSVNQVHLIKSPTTLNVTRGPSWASVCSETMSGIEQIEIPHTNPLAQMATNWHLEEMMASAKWKEEQLELWKNIDLLALRMGEPKILDDAYHHKREVFRYPMQFIQNRPNPWVFGKITDHWEFSHAWSYLHYEAREWERYKRFRMMPLKKKKQVSTIEIDEDDRFQTNWSKFWIHRFESEGYKFADTPPEYDYPNVKHGEKTNAVKRDKEQEWQLKMLWAPDEFVHLDDSDEVHDRNKQAKQRVFDHAIERQQNRMKFLRQKLKKMIDNSPDDWSSCDPSVSNGSLAHLSDSSVSGHSKASHFSDSCSSCSSLQWDDSLRNIRF